MFHTTEYASKFIWHENAYLKPPRSRKLVKTRSSWNLSNNEFSDPTTMQFPFRRQYNGANQQRHQQHYHLDHEQEGEEETKDEIEIPSRKENQDKMLTSFANSCCLRKRSMSCLQLYPMEYDGVGIGGGVGDARGIKSHFLPDSIEVLLDLGLRNCSSRRSDSSGSSDAGTVTSTNSNDGDQSALTRNRIRRLAPSRDQYFTSEYKYQYARSTAGSSIS